MILLQPLRCLAPGLLDQQFQILAGLGLQQIDLQLGTLGRLHSLGAAVAAHQRHADPDPDQPVRGGLGDDGVIFIEVVVAEQEELGGVFALLQLDHALGLLLLGRQQLEARVHRQGLLHEGRELWHPLVDKEPGIGLRLLELEHVAERQLGYLQAAPRLLGIDASPVIGRLGGESLDPGYLALGFELFGMIQVVGQPLLDLLLGLHYLGRQHHAEVSLGEALEGGLLLEHQQLLRLAHLRLTDVLGRIDAPAGEEGPQHLDRTGDHVLLGEGGDEVAGAEVERLHDGAQHLAKFRVIGDGVQIQHVQLHRLIEVGIAGPHIHFGQVHALGRLAQLLCPRHPGLLRRQPVILLDDPAPGLGEADGLRLRRAQHGSQQARAEQFDEP